MKAYGAGQKDESISANPNTVMFIKEKDQSHKIYRYFFINALRTVESFKYAVSTGLAALKSQLLLSTSFTQPLPGF